MQSSDPKSDALSIRPYDHSYSNFLSLAFIAIKLFYMTYKKQMMVKEMTFESTGSQNKITATVRMVERFKDLDFIMHLRCI